jgi:hypothetical protein
LPRHSSRGRAATRRASALEQQEEMGTHKIDLEDKETLWLLFDREQLAKDAR